MPGSATTAPPSAPVCRLWCVLMHESNFSWTICGLQWYVGWHQSIRAFVFSSVVAAPEPFCFMHACFCSHSPSLNNSHLSFANFKFVTPTVTLTAMSEQGDETLKVHHAQRKDRKKAVPTGTAQSQVATELGVVTAQTRALEEKNKTKYIHIHKQLTHTQTKQNKKQTFERKKKNLHKVHPHLLLFLWGGGGGRGARSWVGWRGIGH